MGSLCVARENSKGPIGGNSINNIYTRKPKNKPPEQEVIKLAPPAPMEIEEDNSDDDKSVIGKHKATWTSLLISGYVRQNFKMDNDNTSKSKSESRMPLQISDDILLFIRSWCHFREKIDQENSDLPAMKISPSSMADEMEIIECTSDVYGAPPHHVFGTNVYTKGQNIIWRFRILEHWGCHIGIIEATKISKNMLNFAESKEIGGYGLNTMDNNTFHNAAVPWKKLWDDDIEEGDIIEMELDLTERDYKFGTLVFRKNGDDGGKISFKGIVSNREYKLAIGMRAVQSIALLKTYDD